jgi:hypothetical protein
MAERTTPSNLTCLFIPSPVSIHVSANTFVCLANGTGLVVEVFAGEGQVRLRKFLSHDELFSGYVPNTLDGYEVSFWPHQTHYLPFYVCDPDIVVVVSVTAIVGLAFMFDEDDPIVEELSGMLHTYIVSSVFISSLMIIEHKKSFHSFPSMAFPRILPSCFPSSVFHQLLSIK